MSCWTDRLKADSTEWLLEPENPSVRYFALKDLLGKAEADTDVRQTRFRIGESELVRTMLQKQSEEEYLAKYPKFYTAKYNGLVWQLIVLAELGVLPNEQINIACEYILSHSQEKQDSGFSQSTAVKTGGGRMSEVIPCLSGNMVFSLVRLGFLDDPRVQLGIDWLNRFLVFNDGTEDDPQKEPYSHYEACWGRHTCHMGVVKALKAFSVLPIETRTTQTTNATIAKAAEFMLIHRVYRRSHNFNRASKPGWLKFGFPLMYQTDALEILDVLTALGYADERMEDALTVVLQKQRDDGTWALENNYANERLLVPMGTLGEPDKWITLRAMRVLKRFYSGHE